MKKNDDSLKDKSAEELELVVKDLSREIFDLNNELRMNRKLEKPHLIREKKRTRARALTFLHQKGR